jgi:uncharacterized membrane protein YhaH (DUF805 family)
VNYDALYVSPFGRTTRSQFLPALIVLVAVVAFFGFLVRGRTATFCMLVLMYPGLVLHARRLHDMGRAAWPLLLPALPMLGTFAVWFDYTSFGPRTDALLPWVALGTGAITALLCAVGRSR